MVSAELLEKYGFEEEIIELSSSRKGAVVFGPTGYPKPRKRYLLTFESFNHSVEEIYFWQLNWVQYNQGYPRELMEKITDIFTASEQSAFFGAAQQRLGLQQEKVSQFLATVGKMVKELFQLVRELRILDERLSYYEDSYREGKTSESAEITLKGMWIDMVEQGSKNPASVYGMARELQFVTLPDLFFKYHPTTSKQVDAVVDNLDFNRKVKEVLKRKLRSFLVWKEHTYKEMKTRKQFTLKYLRQHYVVIHMYLSWVRPYLRNIKRMILADKTKSVDLVSAFEGSIVEVEFLAKKFAQVFSYENEPIVNEHVYSVILATFIYRTRPQMNYQQDGWQKGPLHVGKTEMTLRGYTWTKEELERYKRMRDEEDFDLLGEIDSSIKTALEALGSELRGYLEESGEKFMWGGTKEQILKGVAKRPKSQGPFVSVAKGFIELLSAFGLRSQKEKGIIDKWTIERERANAFKELQPNIWYMYKDYKKTHGMLSW